MSLFRGDEMRLVHGRRHDARMAADHADDAAGPVEPYWFVRLALRAHAWLKARRRARVRREIEAMNARNLAARRRSRA